MQITEKLFALRDPKYAAFHAKLIPEIPTETIIGVRVPVVRKLAKTYKNDPEAETFLQTLPHTYYDENVLHALLLCEMKDYDACIKAVKAFLPYVDNWAVNDFMSPKVFKKHRAELIGEIRDLMKSDHTYRIRFGVKMLMDHYLDEAFSPEYLEIPAKIESDAYYVKMMIAWFFATALAKQWDATIPYLEEGRLPVWVHNKAIQKARESFRITSAQKEYLKTLKK